MSLSIFVVAQRRLRVFVVLFALHLDLQEQGLLALSLSCVRLVSLSRSGGVEYALSWVDGRRGLDRQGAASPLDRNSTQQCRLWGSRRRCFSHILEGASVSGAGWFRVSLYTTLGRNHHHYNRSQLFNHGTLAAPRLILSSLSQLWRSSRTYASSLAWSLMM